MDATYHKPKLRWPIDIQVQQGASENDRVVVVQCPLGVSPKPLVLVDAVAPVLSLFQGELSFQEILQRCIPYGLQEDVLRELIRLLDEGLFLANQRFFAARHECNEQFGSLAVRQPALAGLVYPDSRDKLATFVNSLLAPLPEDVEKREVQCLVAPHIDYRRGGACYGKIYPHLVSSSADTYLLMGTSHQYSERMFHLTAKDFSSPLGVLQCNHAFVTRVAHRHGVTRSFSDQYLHRREHSLELQLPFLSTVRPGASIVPILVGSFHVAVSSGRSLREFEEYESFVCSLVEAIQTHESEGRRVCFIAGVDMAHIGPFFGDSWKLTEERMAVVAEQDNRYLDAVAARSCEQLFSHVARDEDARRICGFPTMYTILDVLTRLSRTSECYVRNYEQAIDYQAGCAVTFAGLALG